MQAFVEGFLPVTVIDAYCLAAIFDNGYSRCFHSCLTKGVVVDVQEVAEHNFNEHNDDKVDLIISCANEDTVEADSSLQSVMVESQSNETYQVTMGRNHTSHYRLYGARSVNLTLGIEMGHHSTAAVCSQKVDVLAKIRDKGGTLFQGHTGSMHSMVLSVSVVNHDLSLGNAFFVYASVQNINNLLALGKIDIPSFITISDNEGTVEARGLANHGVVATPIILKDKIGAESTQQSFVLIQRDDLNLSTAWVFLYVIRSGYNDYIMSFDPGILVRHRPCCESSLCMEFGTRSSKKETPEVVDWVYGDLFFFFNNSDIQFSVLEKLARVFISVVPVITILDPHLLRVIAYECDTWDWYKEGVVMTVMDTSFKGKVFCALWLQDEFSCWGIPSYCVVGVIEDTSVCRVWSDTHPRTHSYLDSIGADLNIVPLATLTISIQLHRWAALAHLAKVWDTRCFDPGIIQTQSCPVDAYFRLNALYVFSYSDIYVRSVSHSIVALLCVWVFHLGICSLWPRLTGHTHTKLESFSELALFQNVSYLEVILVYVVVHGVMGFRQLAVSSPVTFLGHVAIFSMQFSVAIVRIDPAQCRVLANSRSTLQGLTGTILNFPWHIAWVEVSRHTSPSVRQTANLLFKLLHDMVLTWIPTACFCVFASNWSNTSMGCLLWFVVRSCLLGDDALDTSLIASLHIAVTFASKKKIKTGVASGSEYEIERPLSYCKSLTLLDVVCASHTRPGRGAVLFNTALGMLLQGNAALFNSHYTLFFLVFSPFPNDLLLLGKSDVIVNFSFQGMQWDYNSVLFRVQLAEYMESFSWHIAWIATVARFIPRYGYTTAIHTCHSSRGMGALPSGVSIQWVVLQKSFSTTWVDYTSGQSASVLPALHILLHEVFNFCEIFGHTRIHSQVTFTYSSILPSDGMYLLGFCIPIVLYSSRGYGSMADHFRGRRSDIPVYSTILQSRTHISEWLSAIFVGQCRAKYGMIDHTNLMFSKSWYQFFPYTFYGETWGKTGILAAKSQPSLLRLTSHGLLMMQQLLEDNMESMSAQAPSCITCTVVMDIILKGPSASTASNSPGICPTRQCSLFLYYLIRTVIHSLGLFHGSHSAELFYKGQTSSLHSVYRPLLSLLFYVIGCDRGCSASTFISWVLQTLHNQSCFFGVGFLNHQCTHPMYNVFFLFPEEKSAMQS